jgi:hypothetical protein
MGQIVGRGLTVDAIPGDEKRGYLVPFPTLNVPLRQLTSVLRHQYLDPIAI